MEPLFQMLLAVLGSSGATGIISLCLQRHWSKKDKHDERIDALVNSQKVMTIDRVRHLGSVYIAAGNISLDDKENLNEMYNAYKALGGNGHLETVMVEINKLQVK